MHPCQISAQVSVYLSFNANSPSIAQKQTRTARTSKLWPLIRIYVWSALEIDIKVLAGHFGLHKCMQQFHVYYSNDIYMQNVMKMHFRI